MTTNATNCISGFKIPFSSIYPLSRCVQYMAVSELNVSVERCYAGKLEQQTIHALESVPEETSQCRNKNSTKLDFFVYLKMLCSYDVQLTAWRLKTYNH